MVGTWFEPGRTADENAPRENSAIKKLVTNRQLPLNTLYSCTKTLNRFTVDSCLRRTFVYHVRIIV